MSKVFCGLGLLFSLLMLFRGLETSGRVNPAVMTFWLLIGVLSAYKLFKRPAPAS